MSAEGNEEAWEAIEKLKEYEEHSLGVMDNPHFNIEEAKAYFELEKKSQSEIYWAVPEEEIHILYRDNHQEIVFLSVHCDALGPEGEWDKAHLDYDAIQEIYLTASDFSAFYKFTLAHRIFQEE